MHIANLVIASLLMISGFIGIPVVVGEEPKNGVLQTTTALIVNAALIYLSIVVLTGRV